VKGGGTIEGLETLMSAGDAWVFHAGTALVEGRWRVRGGRALHVTAAGETLGAARRNAYRAVDRLSGSGWRCRRDIAELAAETGDARAAAGTGGAPW